MRRVAVVSIGAVALSACALKGDVRRVEQQLIEFREETARTDSVRAVQLAAQLNALEEMHEEVLDSIRGLRGFLTSTRGESRSDHSEILRQLVQVQELTGQSQQRLSELENSLRERERQEVQRPRAVVSGNDTTEAAPEVDPLAGVTPEQLYDTGIQQLRRSSAVTARQAFQLFMRRFPDHELAADAQFNLGEAWAQVEPDSATAAYEEVVQVYPDSPRAPQALYKLGLAALRDGRTEEAERYFNRIVAGYPASDEADLAQQRLDTLQP